MKRCQPLAPEILHCLSFQMISKAVACHYHEHLLNSLWREYKLKHFCSLTFWTLWQISIVSFCRDNRQFQLPHFAKIAKHFNCLTLQRLHKIWLVSLCRHYQNISIISLCSNYKRFWLSHLEEINKTTNLTLKIFHISFKIWIVSLCFEQSRFIFILNFSHFAEITKDFKSLTLLWAE